MELAIVIGRYVFSLVLFPKNHFLLGIWYEPVMTDDGHKIHMTHIGFAIFWLLIRKYEKAH
jgi:hypothetical protein